MKKWIGGLLAIGLVVAFFAFGRYGCLAGDGWGMGWGWGPMMGPGGGMFMGMILLIVLVVAVVWWLTKDKDRESGGADKETPLDILKRRYAGGEITKEQFEATKKDLQG